MTGQRAPAFERTSTPTDYTPRHLAERILTSRSVLEGERTADTIFRNLDWRRKDRTGALALHPDDGARLGLASGARARVTTQRGSTLVTMELGDRMQPGHISLPNGQGVGV
jgi:anaerobic selenocysteine-containing dehydrogenase